MGLDRKLILEANMTELKGILGRCVEWDSMDVFKRIKLNRFLDNLEIREFQEIISFFKENKEGRGHE